MSVNPFKVAVVVGLLFGLWHAGWATLVYLGLAQKAVDFVLWMHFIQLPVHIAAFDPQRAAMLVGVTFGAGFVIGGVGGVLWNFFHHD